MCQGRALARSTPDERIVRTHWGTSKSCSQAPSLCQGNAPRPLAHVLSNLHMVSGPGIIIPIPQIRKLRLRNVPIMQCSTDNLDLNLQSPCSCPYITALFPLLPQPSLTPRAQITSQDSLFLRRVTGTTRGYTWKRSGWTGREAPDRQAVKRSGLPGWQ